MEVAATVVDRPEDEAEAVAAGLGDVVVVAVVAENPEAFVDHLFLG